MAGVDGNIRVGFYDSQDIQDRLRTYAKQEEVFKFYALRQANPLSILTVLSEKFGTVPANSLPDWQFNYQQFDELPYSFTLAAASVRPVSGSLYDFIALLDKEAAVLNESHRLTVSGVYVPSAVTAHTHVSATFNASTHYLPETIKVVSKGAESSAFEGNAAASGYTWVKVLRAHPASAVTGQMIAIPISSVLTITNSVARTNQRPFAPLAANGTELWNIIQITRASYGLGEHMSQGGGIKTFLMENGSAYLDLNYELTETHLMKIVERAIIMGRRSKKVIGNESEYETGGILEFVPSANYINFNGAPTVSKINDFVASAFDTTGVREMWMFGDSNWTKGLASAYEGKRSFTPSEQMSVKYRMAVYEIESTGRDGIVYYANAPVLNDIGLSTQCLMLNLTEHNFDEKAKYGAFQIAEKVPFYDGPKDSESYESNTGFKGQWRELYGAWGLIRRLPETHVRGYGMIL